MSPAASQAPVDARSCCNTGRSSRHSTSPRAGSPAPAPYYRPDQGPVALAEHLVPPSVAAAVIGGIFGGRGGYTGTIIGALILTVLTTLLTILQMQEGARRILFRLIVLFVTPAYLRIVEER
ncbi:hypothetical protein MesoLj113b_29410 [Mesorhizobium sp. 113-3-3]|nr:hypothetical protein MesoLj113b_29410 [Mesorhizobium sp. 113-3-3]